MVTLRRVRKWGWNLMFTINVSQSCAIVSTAVLNTCVLLQNLLGEPSCPLQGRLSLRGRSLLIQQGRLLLLEPYFWNKTYSPLQLLFPLTILWANYVHCDWSTYCFSYSAWRQKSLCECVCTVWKFIWHDKNLWAGEESRDGRIKQAERKTLFLCFSLFRGPVWL